MVRYSGRITLIHRANPVTTRYFAYYWKILFSLVVGAVHALRIPRYPRGRGHRGKHVDCVPHVAILEAFVSVKDYRLFATVYNGHTVNNRLILTRTVDVFS